VVSFTSRPLYPSTKNFGTNQKGRCVSHRAGLDVSEKTKIPRPYRDSNPGSSNQSQYCLFSSHLSLLYRTFLTPKQLPQYPTFYFILLAYTCLLYCTILYFIPLPSRYSSQHAILYFNPLPSRYSSQHAVLQKRHMHYARVIKHCCCGCLVRRGHPSHCARGEEVIIDKLRTHMMTSPIHNFMHITHWIRIHTNSVCFMTVSVHWLQRDDGLTQNVCGFLPLHSPVTECNVNGWRFITSALYYVHGCVSHPMAQTTNAMYRASLVKFKLASIQLLRKSKVHYRVYFFPNGATAPSGPLPPHVRGFTITFRHTTLGRAPLDWWSDRHRGLYPLTLRQIELGRTPLDEWSARRTDLRLTTHNTHDRETTMPPAGFEPRNPSKRTAAEPCLRLRGHWDRLPIILCNLIIHYAVISDKISFVYG
jgi:hypothetical protein